MKPSRTHRANPLISLRARLGVSLAAGAGTFLAPTHCVPIAATMIAATVVYGIAKAAGRIS